MLFCGNATMFFYSVLFISQSIDCLDFHCSVGWHPSSDKSAYDEDDESHHCYCKRNLRIVEALDLGATAIFKGRRALGDDAYGLQDPDSKRETRNACSHRDNDALGHYLGEDGARCSTDSPSDAYLLRALLDRHKHDVRNADQAS